MKLLSLAEVEEFMILAKNVHDNSGKVLLKKETVLTSNYIDRLRNFGIDTLYVIDGLTCEADIGETEHKEKPSTPAPAPIEPETLKEPVVDELSIQLPPENHLLKASEIKEAAKGDAMLDALKTTNDILDKMMGALQPLDLDAIRSELPFMTTDMANFKYENAQPFLTGIGVGQGMADSKGMTTGMHGGGMASESAPGGLESDFMTTGAIGVPDGFQASTGIQGASGYTRDVHAGISSDPMVRQAGGSPGAGMGDLKTLRPENTRTRLEPTFLTTAAIRSTMNASSPAGYFREIGADNSLGTTVQQVRTQTLREGDTKGVGPETLNSSNHLQPDYFTTGAIRNITNSELPTGITQGIQRGGTGVINHPAGSGAGEGFTQTVAPEGPGFGNRLEPGYFTTGAIRNVSNSEAPVGNQRGIPAADPSAPNMNSVRPEANTGAGYTQSTAPGMGILNSGNRLAPDYFTTGAIRNLSNTEPPGGYQQETPAGSSPAPNMNSVRPESNTGAGYTQSVSPGVGISNSGNRPESEYFTTGAIRSLTNPEAPAGNQREVRNGNPLASNMDSVRSETNTGPGYTQSVSPGVGISNSGNRPESEYFTTGAIRSLTNPEAPAGFQQEVSVGTPQGPIMNPIRPKNETGGGYSKTIAPGAGLEAVNNGTRLQPVFLTTGAIKSLTNTGTPGVGYTYHPQRIDDSPFQASRKNTGNVSPESMKTSPESNFLTTQALKKTPETPGSSATRNNQPGATGDSFSIAIENRNQVKNQTMQIMNSILESLMGKIDIQKLTVERTKAGINKITEAIIAYLPSQTISEDFRDEIKLEAYQIAKEAMSGIQEGIIHSQTIRKTVYDLLTQIIFNEQILPLIVNLRTYNEGLFVHSMAVCVLAITIGIGSRYSKEILKDIGVAALLHDVGKVFVPKELLEKKGELTEEEKGEIRKHPIYGYEFLHKFADIPPIASLVALRHHEFMDGSGYPYHLKQKDINHYARIVTLADVYDALTNAQKLPYEIIEYIRDMSNSIFDRDLARIFLQNIQPFPVGSMVLLNNGEKAIISKLSMALPARPLVKVVINRAGELIKTPKEYNLEEDLTLFVMRVLSA